MKTYILSVLSAALICGIVELILRKDSAIGKLVKLLSRLLIVISLIAPINKIDFPDVFEYIESINSEAQLYGVNGSLYTHDEASGIIIPKLEAYILDKAAQLQCDISVNISLTDDLLPLPDEVAISGSISPYAKEVLSSYIEDSLGIVREKQRWN